MGRLASVVHFPHPGLEHCPAVPEMPWNSGDHRRKFMLSPGRFIDAEDHQHDDNLVFWGEWEAPSRIVRRWPKEGSLPQCLHEPHWDDPQTEAPRQNTDPWVFGDEFLYSNCRQLTKQKKIPNALQRLEPGSLILFGSTINHNFVLDTALVVRERGPSFVPSRQPDLAVSDAFRVCTLEALATGDGPYAAASFTLYRGATVADQVEAMYSFVPAVVHDGNGPRSPRPVIELPGLINPNNVMNAKGADEGHPIDFVRDVWGEVVKQVRAQGLVLAVHLDTPPRSSKESESSERETTPIPS